MPCDKHNDCPDCCREIEQAVEREREKYGKEIIHFQGFRYRRLLPPTVHSGDTVEGGPEVFSQAEIEREVAGAYEAAAQVLENIISVAAGLDKGLDNAFRDFDVEAVRYRAIRDKIRSLDSSAAQRGKQAIREEALREGICIFELMTYNIEVLHAVEPERRDGYTWNAAMKFAVKTCIDLIDKPGGR